MQLTDVVQDMYLVLRERGGEGLRALFAEDIRWEHGTDSDRMPWVPFCTGRDDVVRAFGPGNVTTHTFAPSQYFVTGSVVTVLVDVWMRRPGGSAGESFSWRETHHWHFDDEGRINRLRQRSDVRVRPKTAGPGTLLAWHEG